MRQVKTHVIYSVGLVKYNCDRTKHSTIWVWVRMPHWASAFGAANLLLEKP